MPQNRLIRKGIWELSTVYTIIPFRDAWRRKCRIILFFFQKENVNDLQNNAVFFGSSKSSITENPFFCCKISWKREESLSSETSGEIQYPSCSGMIGQYTAPIIFLFSIFRTKFLNSETFFAAINNRDGQEIKSTFFKFSGVGNSSKKLIIIEEKEKNNTI